MQEGQWPGTVVVIEFPDLAGAHAWYHSPAYQAILPLRTAHMTTDVILVRGVAADYDPARTAAYLRTTIPDQAVHTDSGS